jgi:hypothetical protein
MLGRQRAFGRVDQTRDLSRDIPLRYRSRLVAEQDLAVTEGNARGLKPMSEGVL